MKTSILMVCLGNICRSPLAQGILENKLPHSRFFVDSAGTANYHIGHQPDKRSIAVAKKYGIDIRNQRGRQFSTNDFEVFDYILVMDNSNLADVLRMAKNETHRQKVNLIMNEIFPGENVDVPDPYYGGPDGFEQVYAMLEEACEAISKKLL